MNLTLNNELHPTRSSAFRRRYAMTRQVSPATQFTRLDPAWLSFLR